MGVNTEKMLKSDKKGWLRIVEAVIAVLIIISVLIFMLIRAPRPEGGDSIHEMQRHILNQVSANETLRAEILDNNKANTDRFVKDIKPVYWNFTTRICNVSDICGMPFYVDKEVYADEILITSTLTRYSPKKLKLFVWMG